MCQENDPQPENRVARGKKGWAGGPRQAGQEMRLGGLPGAPRTAPGLADIPVVVGEPSNLSGPPQVWDWGGMTSEGYLSGMHRPRGTRKLSWPAPSEPGLGLTLPESVLHSPRSSGTLHIS